jgi:hypothetical protein
VDWVATGEQLHAVTAGLEHVDEERLREPVLARPGVDRSPLLDERVGCPQEALGGVEVVGDVVQPAALSHAVARDRQVVDLGGDRHPRADVTLGCAGCFAELEAKDVGVPVAGLVDVARGDVEVVEATGPDPGGGEPRRRPDPGPASRPRGTGDRVTTSPACQRDRTPRPSTFQALDLDLPRFRCPPIPWMTDQRVRTRGAKARRDRVIGATRIKSCDPRAVASSERCAARGPVGESLSEYGTLVTVPLASACTARVLQTTYLREGNFCCG